jgi:hypothetical protein
VVVSVDEPRKNGASARVDDRGMAGDRIARSRFRPDGNDAIVLDRDGLRMGIREVSAPDPTVEDENFPVHHQTLRGALYLPVELAQERPHVERSIDHGEAAVRITGPLLAGPVAVDLDTIAIWVA